MRRIAMYLLFVSFVAVVSCTKEKVVTIAHDVEVEFVDDAAGNTEVSVLYHDFRGRQVTQDEILSVLQGTDAALVFVSCDWSFNASSAAQSVPSSHQTIFFVDGHLACTTLPDVSFRSVELESGNCLYAKVGGCMLMVGETSSDDGNGIVEKTLFSGDGQSWIILLPEPCSVLTDYTFTDCLAAQSGKPGGDVVRNNYVYASQGVWNRMSRISENPLRFSVNIEQE